MSDSVRPHRRQPPRLARPWDSPGKNTGVGCHFLLQCMKVKSESEVAQSCPTLSDPMDCSLRGSSIHGIFQARVLEWGAIAFSLKPPYDPPIPLLGIYPEETKIERDTCIPLFTAALFTIARTWKQPRCPLTDGWIKKLWYKYKMEYSVQFSSVAQSCPTLCDPMNCSLPSSSAHGIFQARVLEWGAIAFSLKPPYDPPIPLLGIYPEETKTEKDTCIPMFTEALFTIARTWKQPRCLSADEWRRKLWYTYR